MALTYSKMLDLETELPRFELPNVMNDSIYSTLNLKDSSTVVMIICNHCPYVIHYHDEIKRIINNYSNKNIRFIAISSNDIINYPDDSPDKMKKLFNDLGISIPYLYDENQDVAKMFKAECTPEFYLFNNKNKLVYRGRLDSSSPGKNQEITGKDLRDSIEACLNNKKIDQKQFPSMGCNIKWK